MRAARRRPGVASLIAAVIAVTLLGGGSVLWQWTSTVTALNQLRQEQANRRKDKLQALTVGAPGAVAGILDEWKDDREAVSIEQLRDQWWSEKTDLARGRVALALRRLGSEKERAWLFDWMLRTEDPDEVTLIADELFAAHDQFADRLWAEIRDFRS